MQGGCTCGAVRYALTERPLFTHACHCTWCQRETGSAFALNAMIESAFLTVAGLLDLVRVPSNSGKGQEIARCPSCHVAVFSHYAGAGRKIAFVRVGTLDLPADCPPDIHIFTTTKLPWVVLDPSIPAAEAFYDRKVYWPQASLDRRARMMERG
jgi:hypothetical protein